MGPCAYRSEKQLSCWDTVHEQTLDLVVECWTCAVPPESRNLMLGSESNSGYARGPENTSYCTLPLQKSQALGSKT